MLLILVIMLGVCWAAGIAAMFAPEPWDSTLTAISLCSAAVAFAALVSIYRHRGWHHLLILPSL